MANICVIVPVYNVEAYLKRCIDSILNQTFIDFELVLIDDGSPDNCPLMCDELQKLDSRIHVIHQENGGLSAARNSGIEWMLQNSICDWVTFIDSDDWIHPEYLMCLKDAVASNNVMISMCELEITNQFKMIDFMERKSKAELWSPEKVFQYEPFDSNSACARLYRKNMFENVRFPVGKLHEDKFTTYKLLYQCKDIAVICHPLYYYFVNNEGIVHSEWNEKRLDGIEAAEQQLKYFYINKFQESYEFAMKEYVHLLTYTLKQISKKNKFQKYKKIIRYKLRNAIKQNKEILQIDRKNNSNIYKYAYPLRFKVYERLKHIVRK